MSYSFTENITLEIPNVEEQLATSFSEAERSNKGLIVEVAAIHEGLTQNHTFYSKEELEKALETWVNPYPKPNILNHDPHSEPVGRVIAAKMAEEEDGTAYIRLQIAVTDPAAVEKIVSQRYLTGSVGGKADSANCSICGEDWAKASAFSKACKHVRGKVYKGKTAFIEMKGCNFKEYSWVNMPADGKAGVKEIHTDDPAAPKESEDADWSRPARLFALSLDKEEVFEYTESENVDILAELKKKDASNQYMQLKGAYLNAQAIEETEEEDILEIAETVSQELADAAATEPTVEPEEDEEVEDSEVVEDAVDDHSVTKDRKTRRAEGQEVAHAKDVDPERSTNAPLSRASEEDEPEITEDSDETELNERIVALESRVEELEQENNDLNEKNAQLKAALKRGLVERVVDTKISLGMVEKEDRPDEIEEHAKRSATSLADSLKDLVRLSPVKKVIDYSHVPTVEENSNSQAVPSGDKEPIIGFEEETTSQKMTPEDLFTEVFMGRRKL